MEINSASVRLVEFGAAWCGPCRAFEPVLRAFRAKHPDIAVEHVDVDADPQAALEYGIRSMPTTVVFRAGAPIGRIVGAQPLHALEAAVRDLLATSAAA